MSSHAIVKIRSVFYDILLAMAIFLFFTMIVMSPTIGNTSFYSKYVTDKTVTAHLQESIKEKTDLIAEKNGIEAKAFDFAVGQNKISSVQKDIVKSAFSGINYDYSSSSKIKQCYFDGIAEYYRFNGMEIDEETLDTASSEASKAFNESLGIHNNTEFKRFAGHLSKTSIIFAVAAAIFVLVIGYRLLVYCRGRTKVFSHYGCALICAGDALVLLFAVNGVFNISNKLYFTDNAGLNYAISNAYNFYFLILAAFGAAIIIAGIMLMVYVKKHYFIKYDRIEQERSINKTLFVAAQDGDLTVEEIVNANKAQIEQEKD